MSIRTIDLTKDGEEITPITRVIFNNSGDHVDYSPDSDFLSIEQSDQVSASFVYLKDVPLLIEALQLIIDET